MYEIDEDKVMSKRFVDLIYHDNKF